MRSTHPLTVTADPVRVALAPDQRAIVGLLAVLATACGGDVRGVAANGGDSSTRPTTDAGAVDGPAEAGAIHDGGSDAHGKGPDACGTTIEAYCASHAGCIREWPADPTALCASKQYADLLTVGETGDYAVAAITGTDYGRYWIFDKTTGRLIEIVDYGVGQPACVAGPGRQLPLLLSFQKQAVDCSPRSPGGTPTAVERACLSASVPDGGAGLGCKVRDCYRVVDVWCYGAGMLCPVWSPTALPFNCMETTLGQVEVEGVSGTVVCCLP